MNGTLNAKKVDLGQDCTVELVTTATNGTDQIAEHTATVVAEAISVTVQHPGLLQII